MNSGAAFGRLRSAFDEGTASASAEDAGGLRFRGDFAL
jgi:hypothetical protein